MTNKSWIVGSDDIKNSLFLFISLIPKMNVVGASVSEAFYAAHETRDIVLPNQTEHVSQIAVDVSNPLLNSYLV